MARTIVGQQALVDRLLIALLANGHVLLEGVPGLAKTLSLKTLAAATQARFQRIQFTPDMLPADIVGTLIYNPQDGGFRTKHGPIFANLVLADEINRAPAKVQSALLEAMQERQVTLGEQTFPLPEPFLVLATQNPIEQEGTYPLPEAQVDRFMLKVVVDYPTQGGGARRSSTCMATSATAARRSTPVARPAAASSHARSVVEHDLRGRQDQGLHRRHRLRRRATPTSYKLDAQAASSASAHRRARPSPLTLAAKACAFLHGRGYVTPQDVKSIGMDVLRHRVSSPTRPRPKNMTQRGSGRPQIFDALPVP